MQTAIALLAFGFLFAVHVRESYRSKRSVARDISTKLNFPKRSPEAKPQIDMGRHDKDHFEVWLHAVSEFHKAQCLYSIALQIASFVAIYGGNKNRQDDMFLLLISADGLIPVALALYTLMLRGHAHCYHVILTAISALLASITGFSIVLGFPYIESVYGGSWPPTCGGLSPQGICSYQLEFGYDSNPNLYFVGGAIACDVIIVSLVLWYVLARTKDLEYLAPLNRFFSNHKLARWLTVTILHTGAILILLSCCAIELYWFFELLKGPSIMDLHDWSFGQIVGITIWAAIIIDLLRNEIGMWLLLNSSFTTISLPPIVLSGCTYLKDFTD